MEVKWNIVHDNFEYSGDLPGVILVPTFGGDDSARLTSAGKEYIALWNSNALFLSINNHSTIPNLEINLEVPAYSHDKDERTCLNQNTTFRAIYSQSIPQKYFDNTKFIVANENIVPSMNTYSIRIELISFIGVRIVVFTPRDRI